MANYPTGVWMDQIAAINGTTGHRGLASHLGTALTQQSGSTPIVFERRVRKDRAKFGASSSLSSRSKALPC